MPTLIPRMTPIRISAWGSTAPIADCALVTALVTPVVSAVVKASDINYTPLHIPFVFRPVIEPGVDCMDSEPDCPQDEGR